MPRLTNNDYLQTRRWLGELWSDHVFLLAYLLPHKQWYLHDYLRFSEDLTDDAALQHRTKSSHDRPALPQQAGRALAQLGRAMDRRAAQPAVITSKRHKVTRVHAGAVVKPQPDIERFVRLLLDLTRLPR